MSQQISIKSMFMSDMAQTNPEPIGIQIDHAEGCVLYDSDGNTYIDLISGISVSSLGHQHPDIQSELHEQIDHHLHVMVYGEVIHSPTVNYARNLLKDLPLSLNSVYFLNSGSEAIDAAMKLAKRFTGRSTFVSQVQAYHGSGQGPLSLMDDDYFTQRYRPLLNGVYRIKQNDIEAIENLPKQGVAAVIVELIQSERGALLADAN
ncbi:MAG: aminotransferase class III-fold pyridoxal phosphate-dependent enzyme, partial [Bacteroidota bacterium]|nr:aminotransferase class III-fold pyridoxal phosphate-dependent enzyme [Bacteroidota bacterium]